MVCVKLVDKFKRIFALFNFFLLYLHTGIEYYLFNRLTKQRESIMNTKECTTCNTQKPLSEFHRNKNFKDGHVYDCKSCVKERTQAWNNGNRDKIKERNRKNSKFVQQWIEVKRRKDPKYRLQSNLRSRTLIALKKFNAGTEGMFDYLGCTKEELYDHIESQFTPEMNWSNYCEAWELDHITPMCTARSAEEVLHLNHYTNLQPLDPTANRKKITNDKQLKKERK